MLDALFRQASTTGLRYRVGILPTERGHTRLLLGSPRVLDASDAQFGSRVPTIAGKRVIGEYAFCDFSKSVAAFDVNGTPCRFDVYVIEHFGVAPEHRRQGFGMSMLEMVAALARHEHMHLTGSPNQTAESLRRKFSARHKGCFEYRDADGQPRLFTYLRH